MSARAHRPSSIAVAMAAALLTTAVAVETVAPAAPPLEGGADLEFGQCPIVLGTVEPSMILSINPTQAKTVDEVRVYVEARDDWTLVSALPGGDPIQYDLSAGTEHVVSVFDDGNNRHVEVRQRVGTGGPTRLRTRPRANDRGDSNLGLHVLATSDDEHVVAVQYGGKSETLTFRRPN